MSDGRKYFCFCMDNCKFETMTKEQILAAIAQAAETGLVFDTEAAFITKVKEGNAGGYVTFWVGTQQQYNELPEHDANCHYIITDSTKDADLAKTLQELKAATEEANEDAGTARYIMETTMRLVGMPSAQDNEITERTIYGEKEYWNPPMDAGVEYRTPERWEQFPVYVKRVALSALPTGKGDIINTRIADEGVDIISATAVCIAPDGTRWNFPVITDYDSHPIALFETRKYDDRTTLTVLSTKDLSTYSAEFVFKYVKFDGGLG